MKMVLVVITTGLCSYGGLAAVAMNYYRSIDKTKFKIDFCSYYELDERLRLELNKNNSDYYVLPNRKRNIISYCVKLKQILKHNKYDIIHVHGNSCTMFFELGTARMCQVNKRIAHVHTTQSDYPIINKLLSYLFHKTYTDAVSVSKKAGDWLFKKEKYTVLNNAIDIDKYMFKSSVRYYYRKKLGIDNYFVIGSVGKMTKPKNQKFLIEIFNEFHKLNPMSKLLIVGDGDLRTKIEQLIYKYSLEDDVILTGMKLNVEEYMQAMDVFVFTSLFEGLGMVLIEAQASGLYCFSSDTVPYESKVTNNIEYISLDKSAYIWAEKIYRHNYGKRDDSCDIRESIRRYGFDINEEAEKLTNIYQTN